MVMCTPSFFKTYIINLRIFKLIYTIELAFLVFRESIIFLYFLENEVFRESLLVNERLNGSRSYVASKTGPLQLLRGSYFE